jgi:hypothetical protein
MKAAPIPEELVRRLHRREAAHEERIAAFLNPDERTMLLDFLRRLEQGSGPAATPTIPLE